MANEQGNQEQAFQRTVDTGKIIDEAVKKSSNGLKMMELAFAAMEKGLVKSDTELKRLLQRLERVNFDSDSAARMSTEVGNAVQNASELRLLYDTIRGTNENILRDQIESRDVFREYYDDYEEYHRLVEEIDEWGVDELDRREQIRDLMKSQTDITSTLNSELQSIATSNNDSLGLLQGQLISMSSLNQSASEFNDILASTGGLNILDSIIDTEGFSTELSGVRTMMNDVFSGEMGSDIDIGSSITTISDNLYELQDVVDASSTHMERAFDDVFNQERVAQINIAGVDDAEQRAAMIRQYISDSANILAGNANATILSAQQFQQVEQALSGVDDTLIRTVNAFTSANAQVIRYNREISSMQDGIELFDSLTGAVEQVNFELQTAATKWMPGWLRHSKQVNAAFDAIGTASQVALSSAVSHYSALDANGNRIATVSSTISNFFGTFKSSLGAALSPVNLIFIKFIAIAAVVGGLISLVFGLEKAAKKYSEELGVSRDMGAKLHKQVLDITTATNNRLATEEDVLSVLKAHQEQYGTILDLNDKANQESVKFAASLGKQYGITTEEAYKLSSTFKQLGADTAMADNLSLYVAEAANLSGISFKTITNDLAEASETVLLHFNGMPEKAAKAAVEIRRMGMSMKQVGAAMDKALDIGGFMNDMTELNMMTGGSANLQTFFDMRFSGASPDEMAEEIAKQYDNMVASGQANEFTMRKFAEATGMSVEELEKGRIIREDLADLTEEQRATLEKHMGNLSKEELSNSKTAMLAAERLATQDKMNASMQKLKGILMKAVMPIAEAFGELLEGLMPVLDIIGGLFKVIGGIIKGIIAPIFKGILMPFKFLANILGSIINFFSSIFGGVSDTAEKSSFLQGIFKAIEVILISIGAIIGGSMILGNLGKIGGVLGGVGEKITGVFGSLKETFAGGDIFGTLRGGAENAFSFIRETGAKAMDGVKGLFTRAGEDAGTGFLAPFQNLGKNLMDKFKSIRLPSLGGRDSNAPATPSPTPDAGILENVMPESASEGMDRATDVGKKAKPKAGKAIKEFLKGLTDGLAYMGKKFGKVVRGGIALGIAGLALAGGFAIALRIAKDVDPAAMIAFSVSLGLLGGALFLMGKRAGDVIKGAVALAAMGVGLLAAGAAFSLIRGIDSQSIITFSVALGALALGAMVLGQFVGLIIPGAIALAALGAALIPTAFAFSLIGTLDANSIIIFGTALGVFALAAAGLGLLAGPIIAGSIALLALGVALIPAAFAFSLIGTLDPTSIVAFSGALIVLAGAAAGFGLLSPLIVAGSFALGVLGLALIPAAAAFSLLGGVDSSSILAFSSSIIMLATGVAMFGLMTPLILLGAVTLTVLSGALNLAASAFSMLSGIDSGMIQEFSNTLISLAYGVAQFGLLTPLILAGAVTLGVLGAALIPTAFAFSLLSGVDSESMMTFARVLTELAMGAAMFGILGALIIAGSVALGVLGLALIPAAFSFSLIAGLDAESLTAFADTLIRLANGAAAFGIFAPLIIMGSVALGVLGAALVPAAFAFSLIGSLDAGSVMIFASTLLFLATAMAGLGVLAGAIALGAVAIGILGAALVPAAFAFSLIGTLDAGSVLLFAGTLLFLANSVAAFGLLSGLIIAGSFALLALGIALIPAAKAFSMISGIDGESIAVFSVALLSLASAAASFGIVSPLIVMGSIALLALGLALIPAAKAFNMISGVDGESLKTFADTLIRLANGAAMFGILSPLIINGSLALAILGFSLLPTVKAFSMLTGLDAGAITAFADTLTRLANGAAVFGILSPLIIMGSIALATLGRALMPSVQAFSLLSGLDAGAITAFADTLVSLAYSASIFGSMAGLIIMGSIALSALGLALRPVASTFAMIGGVDPMSMKAFAESVVIIADATTYAGGRVMAMIKGSVALAAMGKGIRPAAKAFALLSDVDPASITAFGESVVNLANYAVSLAGSKSEMEEGSGALRSLGFTIMMFGLSVMIAQPAIKTVTKLFESLNGLDGQRLTTASEGIRSVADALAYFNERASSGGGGLGAIFANMFSSDPMEKFREMADLADPLMRFAEALERIVAASGGAIGVGESIDKRELEADTRKMERTGEVARESIAESSLASAEVTGTAAAPQTSQRPTVVGGGGSGDMKGVISALEAVASRPIIVQLGEIELKKINRKMRALNNNVS